jgi:hypothetical protein
LHPEETFIYKTNQSFKINKFVQKKKLQRTKRKITIFRTEEKQLLLRLTVEIANDGESIFLDNKIIFLGVEGVEILVIISSQCTGTSKVR